MKKAERSQTRWFAAWRTRERVAPPPDPADYGTAFGLDLSIPDDLAPARPAASGLLGWRARWARRRGAA